ncbi:LacI family DNA-binding transcriptional regulator [Microbacterium capsulatum]|uniref:LacI family DNA-binding transcriptional regulator n=1 Tax=Microbacterium capsulatum TaxID=3041921 RepID=A0ABU0XHT8_9MICO|nr:LacI family DNA-binding transcriptional regulator [Microbacterium sp. ASV81]MDQ4214691.1 LacI family DNA-binding transcriptional regulator [Microbacterium sp. ASV81]
MGRKATLRDVATLAGVHYGTASRALREDTAHLVSPETVERVRSAATKLRYTPDLIAQSLRTNRTSTVGVVVPDIANPIAAALTRGVQDVLRGAGYVGLVVSTDANQAHERSEIAALVSRQVDGLIVASTKTPSLYSEIAASGTPVVLANRRVETDLPTVTASVGDGIEQAIDHLLSLGHREIAYIGAAGDANTGLDRHVAFERVMRARGLDSSDRAVRLSPGYGQHDGAELFERLLEEGGRPTAVIAGNDMMAVGVLSVLRRMDMSCPEDVSIIGCNDLPFMEFLNPPLTTIHVPHAEIGSAAAEALLAILRGEDPESTELPVEFVTRASTAPPSH